MGRKTLGIPLLLVLAGLLGGCVAAPLALGAASGGATVAYLENQKTEEYDASLSEVFDATLTTLREEGYPPPSLALTEPTEAKVQSADVSIAMARFPEGRVRVAIRVGTLWSGDHARRAALLHEAIAARLGS